MRRAAGGGARTERGSDDAEVRVRRLGPSDVALGLQAVRSIKQPEPDPTFEEGYLARFLSRPENVLIVADIGGTPVGFLLAYRMDRIDRDRRMICFYEIDVASSHRRRGVGRAMIEALKTLGRQERATRIWLVTGRSNTAAVSLFEASGAVVAGNGDEVVLVYEPEAE